MSSGNELAEPSLLPWRFQLMENIISNGVPGQVSQCATHFRSSTSGGRTMVTREIIILHKCSRSQVHHMERILYVHEGMCNASILP